MPACPSRKYIKGIFRTITEHQQNAMSTIVLTVFTTSEAYKADINVINEGMQQLSAIDGVLA
jgi:hypothetical protein